MSVQLAYICPEFTLVGMASLILVLSPFLTKLSRWVPYLLCQVTLLVTLAATLYLSGHPSQELFYHNFVFDTAGSLIKSVLLIYAIVVFIYSREYVWERNLAGVEYFVLCLFSIFGMMVLISAASFITLYLGLEILSLPLYALIALGKEDKRAPEAAIKYFVMGAIASGMLLYGISLLFGVTGSFGFADIAAALTKQAASPNAAVLLGLVFVIVGLAFKLGVVPFHLWIPDIYHGAPSSITLFIGTLPELAGFGMAIRILAEVLPDLSGQWQQLLILMAILSLALGNVVAIAQSNFKRMMGYSAISHMGFLLLGLVAGPQAGYSAAFSYVIIYSLMVLGVFGIMIALSREGFECENILDFQGLGQTQPWIAFLMLLLLFSLAGVPPTVGFYAKFLVLNALIEAKFVWLAAVAVVFSVIGAFYYLRVIRVMFFESASDPSLDKTRKVSTAGTALLSLNGLAILALGIYPAPIVQMAMSIVK